MTRRLEVIGGGDAGAVETALRAALSGTGPAILPSDEAVPAGPRHASLASGGDGGSRHPVPDRVAKNVALVIETSGSSGVPKRVALSANALLASAAATESALGGSGQWLLALPTHYIAGVQVLVRSIVAGTAPVAMAPGHFSARTFAALVDELDAPLKFSSIVPAQLARLVDAAESDEAVRDSLRRLDALLIGGQAVPAALFARATDLGVRVMRTYGSSETAGGCVYDGRPIGRTEARVVGGELELAGPMLAEGYLGDDELTERKFHIDDGRRWYRTADSGSVTRGDDGGVTVAVSGRIDNVIISGGIKVALDRVERAVQAEEGFHSAIVVPQPSDVWGQTSVVVTAEPFDDGALERLRARVTETVGRAAAPSRIELLPIIPTLSSGKPDRLSVARALAAHPAADQSAH
ncbi:o-succinylbenzoate--CoA ligase [Subtercola sp. Z020]|uniref:AMP-binding protein n=1 Tax=Subtercola sp. Z020 TaxID=2080582 RepID=UPI000CE90C31|nr:AMP-binding protein [Subtercola sp. Z020]PPF80776.1 o-succinylbenzoate--CoA ligase [Subtercola sp. Z020]